MPTVLAIDDDGPSLKLLRLYLVKPGYTVLTAPNGREGWARLTAATAPIDVIVLNWAMPEMDGLTFLEHLRAAPRFAALPVILQTAAATSQQIAEGLRAGVFAYVTKPYEADTLLALVHAALQRARRQQEGQAEGQPYVSELPRLRLAAPE